MKTETLGGRTAPLAHTRHDDACRDVASRPGGGRAPFIYVQHPHTRDTRAKFSPGRSTNHEMLQLLRVPLPLEPLQPIDSDEPPPPLATPLFCVGVLQRPPFLPPWWPIVLKHCDEVSAYDFRFDLTDGGSGSVSIA